MASVVAKTVLIRTYLRIRPSAPLDKEATSSEISLVAVMKMTKGHADVVKDAERAKAKARKVPEASLQVQKAAMLLRPRL